MFKVVKRDGEIAEFDLSKISGAVAKAFEARQMEIQQRYGGFAGTSGDCRFSEKN